MRAKLVLVWLAGSLWAAGCGSQVLRQSGTIEAGLDWSGSWPDEGAMVGALFDVPPWDPAFEPGPPTAFSLIQRPAADRIGFAIQSPGVPFGTYGGLLVAWQDPDAGQQSEHMRPVSVYGTELCDLAGARAVVLSEAEPDLTLELPAVELFATAAEMRAHFPPVDY